MEYNQHDPATNRALDHLASCMRKFDYGTEEFSLAQKGFSFIANRIRVKEKTDLENVKGR